MDIDDFNPSFKQIAVGMAVVFLLITGVNALVAPDGGYAGDIADSVTNTNNDNPEESPENDSQEEETDPYFDKATNDSNEDSETDTDSSSLNETEKTEIENDFEGYENASNRDNGIYLDRKAIAGEWNNIQVMYEGDPVSGVEVFVNQESIGTTGDSGGVYFQIPDADSLKVKASSENLGTVEETYEVY